jgi:signal transduction histidine kinase
MKTLEAILKSVNEDLNVNSLVQASPVCHKIFDPDFNLKFMSKSGVTALLIENIEDFYGKVFPTDAAPKATRDIVKKHMHLASEGETNTIEYSFEVAGEVIWYRTTISPYFSNEGDLAYITADSMDVTSIKQIEETNRTLIETSSICLTEIHKKKGPGYTLAFMSSVGQKQLGITNISEFYGNPYPPHLYPDKARKDLTEALDRVVSNGRAAQVECELIGNNGNSLWYLTTFSVKRKNEAGEVISITGASQNVTERVINQEALAKSKVEAERANQAKSEFLARMSHELRTPMNAILGFSQLLEMNAQNKLNDNDKKNLQMISSAGNHLLGLINEVLDISKIESGKMDLSSEFVDLVFIVDNVIAISKTLANKNNISVAYQKTPDCNIFAEVDPLRFKQIVLNLISNAIKYNRPNGSVVVSFEKQGSSHIRLGIRDTGRGIPDDKKDIIFKPFERFDMNSEHIEGTGIGLTISEKLIELMNGSIGFESVLGEGSFFYIDVPVSSKTPLSIQAEKQSGLTQLPLKQNFTKKILYIEDIYTNVELVRQILAKRPRVELISASNALDGIELAQSEIPDLILMDINMPGMDGITAFNKLQVIEGTQNIPVIALTADAMDIDIKRALEIGFKSYITKPLNVYDFFDEIDKVLAP